MPQFQLTPGQTIAVVGLSAKPDRPSYDVARVMQQAGFRVIGVNPQYAGDTILGVTCVAALADVSHPIDIVNCFRRSDEILDVATAATSLVPTPKVLWMQQGIANPEARAVAEAAGIYVVENSCIKIAFLNQR